MPDSLNTKNINKNLLTNNLKQIYHPYFSSMTSDRKISLKYWLEGENDIL